MKRALLMLAVWMAWTLLQRRRSDAVATHEEDGLGPLAPFPGPAATARTDATRPV